MARRITPSQFRSLARQQQNRLNQEIRRVNREIDSINRKNKAAVDKWVRDTNREINRVNQQNKRAIEDHNRRVSQHNRNAKAAVDNYNRAVRAHNAQVQRDRQRQLSAIRASSSPSYREVRDSALELSERYERVERSAGTRTFSDLVALSETEASNSAAVAHALVADEPSPPEPMQDSGILQYLSGFSEDLCDRWRGALFSLSPTNPDAARHFCTSVREIFTEILDRWAEDADVVAADPECELTPNGDRPSRRSKIRYLLRRKGADSPEMLGFVEQDIDDILKLFKVFNEATHGTAGKFGFARLQAIRRRVEGGIMFLAAVALDES